MKKYINIFFVLSTFLLLLSCFGGNDDKEISDAKKEMGIIEEVNPIIEKNNGTKEEEKNPEEEISKKEIKEVFEISYLGDNKFLKFDDLDEKKLGSGEIELTGITLTDVDKIVVNYSNKTSDYPDDEFTLQKFKAGDSTFLYRAFSRFETLDFGKNEYIFTAYSGEDIGKLQLIINLEKEEEKIENIVIETTDLGDFPVGEDFGNPKDLGNGKITYSDIKGLEIEKLGIDKFDCSTNAKTDNFYVSEFLDEKIGGYYWWNTCRPIKEDNGISFFVLRLDELGFKYEKHYFLNNGLYGVYELETGENLILEDDDSNNKISKLKEKNNELKEKNEDYGVIEVVDSLFLKLLNN